MSLSLNGKVEFKPRFWVLSMASDGEGCRDWRPLIRSRCKCVLKQDHEWEAELSCVTQKEFGGDWSRWSEFTAVFLR